MDERLVHTVNATAPQQPKKLSDLLIRLDAPRVRGKAIGRVTGVTYDSRQVRPGGLFVARPGSKEDGHRYIADAIRHDAVVIIHENDLDRYEPDVCYLQVQNARTALSVASAWLFEDPAQRLNLVGVTGTDGKSSTAWFTKLLLDRIGLPTGLTTSVYIDDGSGVSETPWRLSTPEPPELHELLNCMVDNGQKAAVIEATSIALAAGRLTGLSLTAAAITNITHEHMEFHGNWKEYRDAKAIVLDMLIKEDESPGTAVLNRDDKTWDHFHKLFPAAQSFSVTPYKPDTGPPAECTVVAESIDPEGLHLKIDLYGVQRRCCVPVGHSVQVGNLAAACLLSISVSGASPIQIIEMLPSLSSLPGRMQIVPNNRGFTVIVDHAHTPAAFEQLFMGLNMQRPVYAKTMSHRIIAVFGSAGEKDRLKRPMQGRIASEYADVVILSDEDPREEDQMSILSDIAAGFAPGSAQPKLIPDRRAAIAAAIHEARAGDTVLLLGKGHEQTIEYADHTQPWNEFAEARAALET